MPPKKVEAVPSVLTVGKNRPDDFTLRHVRKKKNFAFFFPLTGVNDGDLFLVGVLRWTIPAILLWCGPLHWWSCVRQKTVSGFDEFWLIFFLSSEVVLPTKKIVLFADHNVVGCPQHVIWRGELAALIWAGNGAPVMWPPQDKMSFWTVRLLASFLNLSGRGSFCCLVDVGLIHARRCLPALLEHFAWLQCPDIGACCLALFLHCLEDACSVSVFACVVLCLRGVCSLLVLQFGGYFFPSIAVFIFYYVVS